MSYKSLTEVVLQKFLQEQNVEWKCGNCYKPFQTCQQLKRHLEEWHQYIECQICHKTLKKGSLYRHIQIYHKPKKPTSVKEDLFTEKETELLNQCLDKQLNRSVEQLMENINTNQNTQIFHDVNMDDYLKMFDEATNKPSTSPSEEEFEDIQNHWLGMPQEQFEREEDNLLEWAAATL